MAHNHIHIDPALPLVRQADKGHNRWHPDLAPAVRIASGSSVEMETLDALDGQIRPCTTAADLASIEMGRVHPLTGPVHVEGAEPGDLLAVKIEQIIPASRGFTMIMPGFGFLRDLFTTPFLVHWEMANGFAVSPQLPGVRIPGAPFMGVMGVAPSHELLERIVAREADLRGTRRHGDAAGRHRRGADGGPHRQQGAQHHRAARDRRQFRHQVAHRRRHALSAGAGARRAVLGRRRAFRAGRRRILRHRGRDTGDLRGPLRRAEGGGDATTPARSFV